MRISVPICVCNKGGFTMPKEIRDWLKSYNLNRHIFAGPDYRNPNCVKYVFIIDGAVSDDAIAFKLTFPNCDVYHRDMK